jgi:hypothetical protein
MRLYHGTRAELRPGDTIEPGPMQDAGGSSATCVCFTPDLDAAIWAAELAAGDGPGRVYSVAALGEIEDASDESNPPPHPRMSWRSREVVRVIGEVTEWPLYHGTRTGPVEDDPNLTDQRFRGNPTKSFRSSDPVRVVGEVTDWKGHAPGAIQAMKESLERLRDLGIEPIDD